MSHLEEKNKNLKSEQEEVKMPFVRDNNLWVIIGLAFLIIGFLLMIGGGSDDPDVFNEAIFNFRRLTLAPILVLIGFGIQIYAIMKRPKKD
jgi:hypothetical protein